MKFSGTFSARILDVDLQRLNAVFETIDTPISTMEVSKHPGAEQDLVKSGIGTSHDGICLEDIPYFSRF